MFWVKRLSVLVLIAGVAFGWYSWNQSKAADLEQLTQKNALLTARVWIASAKYRTDSTGYIQYRDSLLKEAATSVEEIDRFLKMYENEPENYMRFSNLVSKSVDSLSKIEDLQSWNETAKNESDDSLDADSAIVLQPRRR